MLAMLLLAAVFVALVVVLVVRFRHENERRRKEDAILAEARERAWARLDARRAAVSRGDANYRRATPEVQPYRHDSEIDSPLNLFSPMIQLMDIGSSSDRSCDWGSSSSYDSGSSSDSGSSCSPASSD